MAWVSASGGSTFDYYELDLAGGPDKGTHLLCNRETILFGSPPAAPSPSSPASASASAKTAAACRADEGCAIRGECVPQGDKCVVAFDADCRAARVCSENGDCWKLQPTGHDAACGPKSDADCKQSTGCKKNRYCAYLLNSDKSGSCMTPEGRWADQQRAKCWEACDYETACTSACDAKYPYVP